MRFVVPVVGAELVLSETASRQRANRSQLLSVVPTHYGAGHGSRWIG